MIDFDGYRPNVGIVICNDKGQVLWAKRYGQNSWQFPQGGINDNETPEQAMYRELFEEVGLTRKDVRVLYASKHWLRYKLPKRLLRYDSKPICIGQKQRWFLLQLVSDTKNINMQCSKTPEFEKAFNKVHSHLKNGDTELVNLTFATEISAVSLSEVYQNASAKYKMLYKDDWVCFSPEIFVKIEDNLIKTYPMKGTISATIPDAEATLLHNEKEIDEHHKVVRLLS